MEFLQKITQDKFLHIIAGIIIFAVFNFTHTWQIGIAMCAIIGAAKEFIDFTSENGTPDTWDFVATCFGGVLGLLCTIKTIL